MGVTSDAVPTSEPPQLLLCPAGETTVVLAIVQANVDFSTAAAIKLAKKFDPNRDRTMVSPSCC